MYCRVSETLQLVSFDAMNEHGLTEIKYGCHQERQVGYMPQGNIVFPHLSVEHNITYSKRGTPDICDSLLKRLGLKIP